MRYHSIVHILLYCLFFIFNSLYTMDIESYNQNFLTHKDLLHILVFVWEDMRYLTHAFNTDDTAYDIFDSLADKLMILHELILKHTTLFDKMQSEEIETNCVQTVTDIVYDTYVLTQIAPNRQIFQLHDHAQALHKAIVYTIYR